MHETVTVHKLSEKRKLLGSRVVSKENDEDLCFNSECTCARGGDRAQGRSQGGTRRSAWARSLVCVVHRELPPPLTRVSDTELLHSRKLLLSHCRGWESQRAQGHRLKTHFPKQTVYACLSPRPTKSSTQKTSPTLPAGTITVHDAGLGPAMLGMPFTICTRKEETRFRPSFTKSPAN